MMKDVLILAGAGVSKCLNYPTSTKFFNGFSLDGPENIRQKLYQALRAHLKKKIIDVEHVLYAIDTMDEFLRTPAGRILEDFVTTLHGPNLWREEISKMRVQLTDRCFDLYARRPTIKEV